MLTNTQTNTWMIRRKVATLRDLGMCARKARRVACQMFLAERGMPRNRLK